MWVCAESGSAARCSLTSIRVVPPVWPQTTLSAYDQVRRLLQQLVAGWDGQQVLALLLRVFVLCFCSTCMQ